MRLLNTSTGRFHHVDDPRQCTYAILSHVWAKKEGDPDYPEKTYQDIRQLEDDYPKSSILPHLQSLKIQRFCEEACKDGFAFGWVDTCCIDKTSSAELSEAINSMYDWYRLASLCYVFLFDVGYSRNEELLWKSFEESKWFKRSWTLQELLAPNIVVFRSSTWKEIGYKNESELATHISKVTGIGKEVIMLKKSLFGESIASRMSWAAEREATREEDKAYSLMGIFGVNMPTIYGEGRHAFIRLQEEILKRIPDQTIFTWGMYYPRTRDGPISFPSNDSDSDVTMESQPRSRFTSDTGPTDFVDLLDDLHSTEYLLAKSPYDFRKGGGSTPKAIPVSIEEFTLRLGLPQEEAYQVYTVTPHGIRARLPVARISFSPRNPLRSIISPDITPTHLAVLACQSEKSRLLLALLLRKLGNGRVYSIGTITRDLYDDESWAGDSDEYLSSSESSTSNETLCTGNYRTIYLNKEQETMCRERGLFKPMDVYIPHQSQHMESERPGAATFLVSPYPNVRLFPSCPKRLKPGYELSPSSSDVNLIHRGLRITSDSDSQDIAINVNVGCCDCDLGKRLGLLAVSLSSRTGQWSLENDVAPKPHTLVDASHVYAWKFRDGVATRRMTMIRSITGARLVIEVLVDGPCDYDPFHRLGIDIRPVTALTTHTSPLEGC